MSVENPTARELFLSDASTFDEKVLERMERNFFHRLRLPNGTAKTTYRNRLDDIIAACNRHLEAAAPPLRLMDIGISSGVTTREWMDVLDRLRVPYTIDALDLSLFGDIESFGAKLHVLRDTSGRALQFELLGAALSNHYGYDLPSFLRRVIPVSLVRALFALLRMLASKRIVRVRVPLLTRGLQESSRLRLREADILKSGSLSGTFHMIRAANILNRVYFNYWAGNWPRDTR